MTLEGTVKETSASAGAVLIGVQSNANIGLVVEVLVTQSQKRGGRIQPGKIIAGQALMALADTAMVVALWSALGAFRPVATVDMTTTFMRPATQTAIVAEATVLRLGRTLGFCQVRLLMDVMERLLVAHGVGTYSIPPVS